MRERRAYVALFLAVVGLDQLAKQLIDRFMELHESRPLLEGLLRLTYVQNRGGAFGLLSDADIPYRPIVFSLVSLVAFGAIAAYAFQLPAANRLAQTALALIMGGAVGNLIDRVRLGYVIDYVDAYWGPHHWPAFNVADSCISVGVGLLVLDILLSPQDQPAKPGLDATAGAAGQAE
jgi:signal peptidase II